MTDPKGYVTSFAYDALGRRTRTTYPSNTTDSAVAARGYDDDSRIVSRSGPFFTSDALGYDALNRVVSGTIADVGGQGGASVELWYNSVGAVVYATGLNPGATFEEAISDGLGNRVWQRAVGVDPNYMDRQRNLYLDQGSGREDYTWLVGATPFDPFNNYPSHFARMVHAVLPDASGNSEITYGWTYSGSAFPPKQAVSYFDADDRMRIFNQHVDIGVPGTTGGIYEEYRYDALGRRVLVRSRCTNQQSNSWCRGYVERTVWDGDQVLYELRARGHDAATADEMENDFFSGSPNYNYDVVLGRVGYVHASGIDAPIAVYRMGLGGQPSPVAFAPHADWRGSYEVGSVIGGTYHGWNTRDCEGLSGCPLVPWPAGHTTMDGELPPPTNRRWFGNLIAQHSDGSGLQYMRNRYYDPATGRFTQADPIGLAGGLNLYGFAGGDPVSYTDPFGLCPDPDDPNCSIVSRVTTAIGNWFNSVQGQAAQALAQGVAVIGRAMTSLLPGSRRAAEAVTGIDEGGNRMTGGQRAAAVAGAVAEGAVNVAGGEATESAILNAAERWLGRGYREIAPGVFRSADDARQFRMVSSNLSRAVPHVNFEAIAADGRTILENSHVTIVP